MPSFDITSEVDLQEADNAINQTRKEIAARFDFKGANAEIEFDAKENRIRLSAADAARLKGLLESLIGKLARRNVDLRNVERKDPEVAPSGHARQEIVLKQGIEHAVGKEIVAAIKASGLKVQTQNQGNQLRVTGKKRDDLQAVIAFLRGRDFGVALQFGNFRD